jgi:hypothetical protein
MRKISSLQLVTLIVRVKVSFRVSRTMMVDPPPAAIFNGASVCHPEQR